MSKSKVKKNETSKKAKGERSTLSKKSESKTCSIKKNKEEGLQFRKQNLVSALMYLFPFGLLWYFYDKELQDNRFVKFHFKQGLVLLTLSSFAVLLSVTFIGMIFSAIIGIISLIYSVIGIIYSFIGRKEKLPIIGKYENKFYLK